MKYSPPIDGMGEHAGHRSPETAGRADSYYGRPRNPNFAMNGVTIKVSLTRAQKDQYYKGFDQNEAEHNFKDWR